MQIPTSLIIPKLTAAPGSPVSGQLYYDTTANLVFFYNGTLWVPVSKTPTRQVLTAASGTYTTPAGCRAILVECVAAGGGGGGVNTASSGQLAAAGGGGGGAYSASLIQSPSASYSYQVGAGCAGGAAGANNGVAPAAANDSWFGATTTLLAKAGGAGLGMTSSTNLFCMTPGGAAGPGGSGVGDVRADGDFGGMGIGVGTGVAYGGFGGRAGMYSAARGQGAVVQAGNGSTGLQYGGGGGGGWRSASTGTQSGGAGAAGVIIVTEFYG